MNDLQVVILTLFLGLFGMLVNYLLKFFRSAAKSAEEIDAQENDTSHDDIKQVKNYELICALNEVYHLL